MLGKHSVNWATCPAPWVSLFIIILSPSLSLSLFLPLLLFSPPPSCSHSHSLSWDSVLICSQDWLVTWDSLAATPWVLITNLCSSLLAHFLLSCAKQLIGQVSSLKSFPSFSHSLHLTLPVLFISSYLEICALVLRDASFRGGSNSASAGSFPFLELVAADIRRVWAAARRPSHPFQVLCVCLLCVSLCMHMSVCVSLCLCMCVCVCVCCCGWN